MSKAIAPSSTVTFTVTKRPSRPADRKTLERLMRMQKPIQNGLKRLARRRRQKDNIPTTRAGRIWINRKRATKLVSTEPGDSFTLTVTPQIIPDINSVLSFLDAKAAK